MAMRITTKMMQNTSLRNLNTNKARQEDLTNQLATGKKISRPSDDPVIAIRALKLNSTLDKIDQYYEKNAEDAESWLDLTASAISTVNDILSTTMKPNINQACNSYQEASDRQAIITNLQQAITEIYSTGNADSGGRSIFTGYRTDMPLTFQKDETVNYTITEQLTNADIGTKTFVSTGSLKNINEGNFNTITEDQYDVSTNEIYRIRLAYSDTSIDSDVSIAYDSDVTANMVNNSAITFKMGYDNTEKTVTATLDADGNVTLSDSSLAGTYSDGVLTISDSTINESVSIAATIATDGSVTFGDTYTTTISVGDKYATNTDEAYKSVIGDANKNAISYIADTGEIIFGSNVQERLSKLSSSTEIRVTYDKKDWEKDDLIPVHYFYTVNNDTGVEYNKSFLSDPSASGKQIIEYDIGNNQSIRVNTTADEVFTHDMGRDAEEVMEMLNEYSDLDDSLTNINKLIDSEDYSGTDLEKLNSEKTAIEKAMTYVGDKINKRCSALLTNCDNYAERTQLAETNCGSRGTRLTLIQNRLSVQQTNFEELVSENEDADYTDLAIQLKSVEMTYEAALSSISYVLQTTLLDFI